MMSRVTASRVPILLAAAFLVVGAAIFARPLSARASGTFTVITNADGAVTPACADTGSGTLRECIQAANASGGTTAINFAPTVVAPIVLTQGELHVTGSQALTITGLGQSTTIVDGNDASRVFEVDSGASVTMTALTVRNGHFTNSGGFDGGGGIKTRGTLVLTNVTVSGNKSTAGLGGTVSSGGILQNLGDVTLSHVTMSNNSVVGNDAAGGAIQVCCDGTSRTYHLTISDSNFTGNSASLRANVTNGQANGGAIAINNEGVVSIARSTFSSNIVTVTGQSNSGSSGAILNRGGLTVDASSFLGNSASVETGAGGGAISNCCSGGATPASLSVSNSLFDHNSAVGPGSDGGAISNCCGSTLTVSGSTIHNNIGNGAGSTGGGIDSGDRSPLTITNSTIAANTLAGAGGSGANIAAFSALHLVNDTINGGNGGTNLHLGPNAVADVVNTIVAGVPSNNCHVMLGGVLNDTGHNLEDASPGTCGFSAAKGDQLVADAHLDGLKDNGGPTPTEALLTGSAAIDHASSAACPTTDQRGRPRTSSNDPVCDIGAFEVQAAVVNPTPPALPKAGLPGARSGTDGGIAVVLLLVGGLGLLIGLLRPRRVSTAPDPARGGKRAPGGRQG